MAKTGGLFMFVIGFLALLATVAQINPIWLYGPYHPDIAAMFSQPDWYVGFMEGSLRLMPNWTWDLAGHTVVWNVFLPAAALPALFFILLYLYPFFEQYATGDLRYHHVLDRPRNVPARTALGAAVITQGGVLLLAGGDDLIAARFDAPVEDLVWTFRVCFFLLPVIAFVLTRYACLALQRRDGRRLSRGLPAGLIERQLDGSYVELVRPLPAEEEAELKTVRPAELIRPIPRHILPLPTPSRIRAQARARLNHFYTRYEVETPSSDGQQGRYEVHLVQQESDGEGDE